MTLDHPEYAFFHPADHVEAYPVGGIGAPAPRSGDGDPMPPDVQTAILEYGDAMMALGAWTPEHAASWATVQQRANARYDVLVARFTEVADELFAANITIHDTAVDTTAFADAKREIVEGNARAATAFNRRLNELLDLAGAEPNADPFVRIAALASQRAARAEQDSARLDWLASFTGDVDQVICPPGNHGGGEGNWLLTHEHQGPPFAHEWEGPTLRDAIDAARASGQPEAVSE